MPNAQERAVPFASASRDACVFVHKFAMLSECNVSNVSSVNVSWGFLSNVCPALHEKTGWRRGEENSIKIRSRITHGSRL